MLLAINFPSFKELIKPLPRRKRLKNLISRIKILQDLAPYIQSRLLGITGPVPPPLLIR
jgi:hypothetical protein